MTEAIIGSPETRLRDAVKRRIAARYRAEFRFRLYGMIAIALTALFLLIVLVDILLKGLPAFTVHQFRFDVPVVLTDIDPAKAKDPEVLRGADYHALVRDALRNHFPDVKDRVGRRRLDGLISSGASDNLRHQVVADPSLVGKTLSIAALVSADANSTSRAPARRSNANPAQARFRSAARKARSRCRLPAAISPNGRRSIGSATQGSAKNLMPRFRVSS